MPLRRRAAIYGRARHGARKRLENFTHYPAQWGMDKFHISRTRMEWENDKET
jgi:hypothetical protein